MADITEQVQNMVVAENTIETGLQRALEARGKAPTQYECENGVVLGLKRIPRALIAEAINRFNRERPKPPVLHDAEKDRDIVNDNDPVYLDAVEEHNAKIGRVTTSLYLGMGTFLKSTQKELDTMGVEGPDSDDWVSRIHEFMPELEVPERGSKSRYTAWLEFYCLTNEDNTILNAYAMGYYGQTREEAVGAAMDSFRSDVRRDSDNGSGPATVGAGSQDSDRS